MAKASLQCYLASTNYTLHLIDLDMDERVRVKCNHFAYIFFKRHCAIAVIMELLREEVDWVLVLDADTGVVNPNHCVEEWIDERVELIFFERFFSYEIASGSYIAKNTPFARNFLMRWANYEFHLPQWSVHLWDAGALQIHVLTTVLPGAVAEAKACHTLWANGSHPASYAAYVVCVRMALGANRIFPNRLRIYRRAHGWVRDGWFTEDAWSEPDFMVHVWKKQSVGDEGWVSPFTRDFNQGECQLGGYAGWHWREEKRWNVSVMKEFLAKSELDRQWGPYSFPTQARVHPFLDLPDIGECYPNCDMQT